MRKRESSGGLTVNAVAGTYVVFLGIDLAAAKQKGCLGFSIRRTDETEGERYWLEGMKTFAATDPGIPAGGKVSSDKHPFQTFQWSDLTAKAAHAYVYEVFPVYGTPTKLVPGPAVSVAVRTEDESVGTHRVFFNRGAISSQAYALRFGKDKAPSDVGPAAYEWLSRGLLEGFEAFVARAADNSYALHAAIYEFQWPAALAAFKKARAAGARVSVVYDGIDGSGPKDLNEEAIAAAEIKTLCRPRTVGKIMHDKFVVLTKDDKPVAVWTGSTNLTENGLFGHLNVGHLVEDAAIAGKYLEAWRALEKDPTLADLRVVNDATDPTKAQPVACQTVFSPRKGDAVLDWYAKLAGTAEGALFMTFAFGMSDPFVKLYDTKDDVLRLALMEKEGNGAGLQKGKEDVARIRALPNVVVAVANNLKLNELDRWVAERRSLSSADNVHWIHTKFMLVDPLGASPLVVTGSANFSKASTDTNDENMLVIRGDTRVADIYFTEYMRLFATYAFREAVALAHAKHETFVSKSLDPTDAWVARYFVAGQDSLRRRYYSGS